MAWGQGRLSDEWHNFVHLIGGNVVPRVALYKYLDVLISCGGSWLYHLQHMCNKMVDKTRQIVAWARANAVPLTLATRVWDLYVLRTVSYGAALCSPSQSAKEQLDHAHCHAARLLLGSIPHR